jgi:hypothetical protein
MHRNFLIIRYNSNTRLKADMELSEDEVAEVVAAVTDRLRADAFQLTDLTVEKANRLLGGFHDRAERQSRSAYSARHVVIAGRRGAGKTSTMVRAYLKLWLDGNSCA